MIQTRPWWMGDEVKDAREVMHADYYKFPSSGSVQGQGRRNELSEYLLLRPTPVSLLSHNPHNPYSLKSHTNFRSPTTKLVRKEIGRKTLYNAPYSIFSNTALVVERICAEIELKWGLSLYSNRTLKKRAGEFGSGKGDTVPVWNLALMTLELLGITNRLIQEGGKAGASGDATFAYSLSLLSIR
jgi:hypothetical protein